MAEIYSVNLTKQEGLYCEYEVLFSGDGLNDLFDKEIDDAQKKAKLNGFRPGKVPRIHIMKQYGEGIFQETVTKFVNEKINDVIQENGIEFLQSCSKIDDLKMGDCKDLTITIKGEKMPEFKDLDLNDFETESVEMLEDSITDKDIQEAIQKIKEHEYCQAPEDSCIADKNRVTIEFDGKIDGESFEGGTGKDLQVIIGNNQLMPGLEPQILGMKIGEEKECTFVMPETHKEEKLRNKEVQMMMKITSIEVVDDSLSDEDLIVKLKVESVEKLKENIKNNLIKSTESQIKFINRKNLFDKLDTNLDFELPKFVLEKELKQLSEKDVDNKEMNDDNREKIAKRRIKLAIFLIKLARKHNIEVVDQDIFNYMMNECGNDQQRLKMMIEELQKNQNFRSMVNNIIIEGKASDFVDNNIKKNAKKLSYGEIKKLYEDCSKL